MMLWCIYYDFNSISQVEEFWENLIKITQLLSSGAEIQIEAVPDTKGHMYESTKWKEQSRTGKSIETGKLISSCLELGNGEWLLMGLGFTRL